jgi:hypothetical protein
MHDRRIEARLVELRAEHVAGERSLAELDARRDRLVSSILRIGGAIQVLEELVASVPDDSSDTSARVAAAELPVG